MGEPSAVEVLAWMSRTGRTAADAADHFWGSVTGDERLRLVGRIRQWASRARKTGAAGAPPSYGPPPARDAPARASNRDEAGGGDAPRPPPDLERARLPRVPFLEWELSELLADLAWVRAAGLVGRIASLDARVGEVRAELDQARQDGGRAVALERSPAAVADEMERRAKRIRELAARAAEREL